MLGTYFLRPNKNKNDQMMTPEEKLASERILFLYGIMDTYVKRFDAFGPTLVMDTLLAMDKDNNNPIKLVIDSPGGYVDIGFSLYDTMKTIRSPVHTVGRSVQSMATIILAAGKKGHRFLYPNSRVMLHLPLGQMAGDSEELKIQQQEIELLKNRIVEALIECGATKNKKQILKDINREYWMSAQEAINYGVADKIVSVGDL